jgi:predicted transposase YbfD/YdcC
MGCQRAIAEQIVKHGGNYGLVLKRNHKHLYEAVEALFQRAHAMPSVGPRLSKEIHPHLIPSKRNPVSHI